MRHLAVVVGMLIGWGLLQAEPVQGEDWPGWRGPRGDGSSLEQNPPLRWDGRSGQNILWKTPLPGQGHSSPAVWQDRIFVSSCLVESGERILLCIDRPSGEILWQETVLSGPLETKHARNSHASSTPATDGQSVYIAFLEVDGSTIDAPNVGASRPVTPGRIVVAAYDLEGNRQWRVVVGDFVSAHGFCSNPVLYQDLLILNGDHDGDSYIVALDKRDGKIAWKTPRQHKIRSYVTPLIRQIQGRTQMVLSGSKHIVSLDPQDGSQHWKIAGPTEQFVASMVYDGDHFYMAAGFPTHHVMAIRPDGTGDVTGTHVAWHVTNARSYVPSPAVLDGYLIVADDRGTGNCFDAATGQRHWQARLGQHFSGSPVTAAGLVYLTDDGGVTKVIRPGPELDVVAENRLGEACYSSAALAHGQLLLRGEKHLYCIGSQ